MLTENAELTYQQIIDIIDNAHVDYSDEKLKFDVGEIIKNVKLKGLQIAIRKSNKDGYKLAKDTTNDKFTLVLDVTKYPKRHEIDSLLRDQKKIYGYFQKAIAKYKAGGYASEVDGESNVDYNNRESFEAEYKKLSDAVSKELKMYKSSTSKLNQELEITASPARKHVLQKALQKLKDTTIGEDGNAFARKMLKLPEAKFVKELENDMKKKVLSRLISLFPE